MTSDSHYPVYYSTPSDFHRQNLVLALCESNADKKAILKEFGTSINIFSWIKFTAFHENVSLHKCYPLFGVLAKNLRVTTYDIDELPCGEFNLK